MTTPGQIGSRCVPPFAWLFSRCHGKRCPGRSNSLLFIGLAFLIALNLSLSEKTWCSPLGLLSTGLGLPSPLGRYFDGAITFDMGNHLVNGRHFLHRGQSHSFEFCYHHGSDVHVILPLVE